jgi:hypothetical protein
MDPNIGGFLDGSQYNLSTGVQIGSIPNPTQMLNQAQAGAFEQIKSSPADPNLLRETASQAIGDNVSNFQTQIQNIQNRQTELLGTLSGFFQSTPTETKLNQDLNNLDTAYEKGVNNLQDRQAPMEFITGALASTENRYVQQRNTLIRQLQSETSTRQQKLQAAQFLYDANRNAIADTISLYNATKPDNIGNIVDPVTGEMTVIMQNPITGEVTKKKVGQVQTPQRWIDNLKFAEENGVNKQFFTKDGKTIINTNSGREYSTPEQFFADGGSFDEVFMKNNVQQINAGNNDEKALVLDMAAKYVDAGISSTDSLATAQSKIQNSRIYKDQVRGPVGSSVSTPASDVDQYANDVMVGKLNLTSVPQKIRAQVSKKVDELKANASAKYDTEFEARIDYDSEIRQLEQAKNNGQLQGTPSEIINALAAEYGSKISKQEIQSTIRSLFGVK